MTTCSPSRTQTPARAVGEHSPCVWRRHRSRPQRAGVDEVIALIGKIDRRFEARVEIEQRRVDLRDGPRQRTVQLIESRAGLKRRRGVDEIGDGLGLREIDPAVQKCPERKLAWLGEPGARRHRRGDDRAQNDRASVGAQLNDIVPGIGVGRRKIGGDDVIDRVGGAGDRLRRPAAIRRTKKREGRVPRRERLARAISPHAMACASRRPGGRHRCRPARAASRWPRSCRSSKT